MPESKSGCHTEASDEQQEAIAALVELVTRLGSRDLDETVEPERYLDLLRATADDA